MARPFPDKQWRCTELEVKELLAPGNDYDEDKKPSLRIFIHTAWILTSDVIRHEYKNGLLDEIDPDGHDGIMLKTLKSGGGESPNGRRREFFLGSERHALIEAWLGAHFYKLSDRGLNSESINGSSGSFMGSASMGFEATQYGQQAKRLDGSGYLVILDERRIAQGGITAPGMRANCYSLGPAGQRREETRDDCWRPGATVVNEVTPNGDVNGVNTTFTLPHCPASGTPVYLLLNGTQTTNFTISEKTITMGVAPAYGTPVLVIYSHWI